MENIGVKLQSLPVSATLSVVVGIAQTWFLLFCWAYIAAYSPLLRWLVDLGLQGGSLRAVLFPLDFLTSVVLSFPAAFALLRLRPSKLWLYLLLAIGPGFVWSNRELIGDPLFAQFAGSFALGWLPQLFALPVAAWILRFLLKPGAPNNSFQGTPNRFAAGRP